MSDANAPWQNGLCEKHGGWLKSKIMQELESGDAVINHLEDYDMMAAPLLAAKNR